MRTAALVACLLAVAAGLVWFASRPSAPAADGVDYAYRPDGRYDGPPVDRSHLPNLVLLVVDTLRADCVGSGPDDPADMPFVSGLGARGLRATNVTAPAPATYPSITSLLTGLLPYEHRIDHTPYTPVLPRSVTTYAEVLSKGHGYETAAFLEVRLGSGPEAVLQGFGTVGPVAPLRATREHLTAWDAKRAKDRPFFLLLHTYEAHDPYGEVNHPWPELPPDPEAMARADRLYDAPDEVFVERLLLDRGVRLTWLEQDPRGYLERAFRYYGRGYARKPMPELARKLERAYRDGVRWVDGEVARTVAHLEALGLLRNTLLVITADHGEAFGEHGVLLHGRSLHHELVHIPLVALGAAPFDGGRRVDTSFGLVDVLPTFCDWAGLPPIPDVAGRSVLQEIASRDAGRAVLAFEELTPFKMGRAANTRIYSARTATETYIVTYDMAAGTIVEQLFDRATDPGERRDLTTDGRLGDLPVSAELADAIERLRDRIWESVESSQAHVQTGYGAGVATVGSRRPSPARPRTP